MTRKLILILSAAIAVASQGIANQLTAVETVGSTGNGAALWFRAADAVVDDNGKVTSLTNRGTLAKSLPRLVPSKEDYDVTLTTSDATFGGQASLNFGGNGYLVSENQTSLGYDTSSSVDGMAWFAVYRYDSYTKNNSIFGLASDSPSAKRFAAFATQSGIKQVLRSCFLTTTGLDLSYAAGSRLSSVSTFIDGSTRYARGFLNSQSDTDLKSGTWSQSSRIWNGVFHLGDCGLNWNVDLTGSIAEFILFNRPLSARERFKVEGELAARYSFSLKPSSDTTLSAQLLAGFCEDACTIGSAANGGVPEENVVTKARSGNLEISYDGVPEKTDNSLLYVAHNGEKVWCLAGTQSSRGMAVKLVFKDADYSSISRPKLCYRADGSGTWSDLAVAPERIGSDLVFCLPSSWANGHYAIGDAFPTPALWYCADRGVSIGDDGNVTNVNNLGTLGSALDVAVTDNGTVKKVVSESLGGQAALRFDASGDLESVTSSDLGLTQSGGATIISVFNVADLKTSGPIYGLKTSGGKSNRFWQDFHSTDGWHRNYFYGTASASSSSLSPQKKWGSNIPMIASFNVCNKTGRQFVSGVDDSANASFNTAIASGIFCLGGNGLADWSPSPYFNGDIAEVRVYVPALSPSEQALVEVELSAKYGIAVSSVGATVPKEIASHGKTADVIGTRTGYGRASEADFDWTDGVWAFEFDTTPSGDSSSLTYIGTDGNAADFGPVSGKPSQQELTRTIYLSSAAPAVGGTISFSCADVQSKAWKYLLYRKSAEPDQFIRLNVVPTVEEGKVAFPLANLDTGVYKLVRRPANLGLFIVFK